MEQVAASASAPWPCLRAGGRGCGACAQVDAHEWPLAAVALSGDGSLVASASQKGTVIRIHSVASGAQVRPLPSSPLSPLAPRKAVHAPRKAVHAPRKAVHAARGGAPALEGSGLLHCSPQKLPPRVQCGDPKEVCWSPFESTHHARLLPPCLSPPSACACCWQVLSVRRGSLPQHIFSLAFAPSLAPQPPFLVAASGSGTLHLFGLAWGPSSAGPCVDAGAGESEGSFGLGSPKAVGARGALEAERRGGTGGTVGLLASGRIPHLAIREAFAPLGSW